MICRRSTQNRSGAATVEFAVLAPFLAFCFVVGVDVARVFYYSLVVTYCARDGATYGMWSQSQAKDAASIAKAAIADDSAIARNDVFSNATATVTSNTTSGLVSTVVY